MGHDGPPPCNVGLSNTDLNILEEVTFGTGEAIQNNLQDDLEDDELSIQEDERCNLSIDEAVSDDEEVEDEEIVSKAILEKITDWKIDNVKWELNQPKVQQSIVILEHLDAASAVISETKSKFRVNGKLLKFAPSASTKFTDSIGMEDGPSKLYCKGTTLLLMACKANKWDIVETLLQTYPDCYKIGEKKQHPLLKKDDHGSIALDLAILANMNNIVKLMIDSIDEKLLKSAVVSGNKTEIMSEEILQMIAEKTGIKSSKKSKNKSAKKDSKIFQKLKLFGKSCGFSFQSLDGKSWKCEGEKCQVEVTIVEDMVLSDNNHYPR